MTRAKQAILLQQALTNSNDWHLMKLLGTSCVRIIAKLLKFLVPRRPYQLNTTLRSEPKEKLINRGVGLCSDLEHQIQHSKRRHHRSSQSAGLHRQLRKKSRKQTAPRSKLPTDCLYPLQADVTEAATKTYQHIDVCIYAKGLGLSGFAAPNCTCSSKPKAKDGGMCQDDSTCDNQACCYECPIESPCGEQCQNRRFQRGQVADVSVILVDGKGYGLRANTPLNDGQFILEYTGEVVSEKCYNRRKVQYEREGVQHFYGFELQENEIIDATKKGNLGRFCNHSCAPNCLVRRWAVNGQMRLGIFAAQDIRAGEELVFDYETKLSVCRCGTSKCYSGQKLS